LAIDRDIEIFDFERVHGILIIKLVKKLVVALAAFTVVGDVDMLR
jgi:hypothetical protein